MDYGTPLASNADRPQSASSSYTEELSMSHGEVLETAPRPPIVVTGLIMERDSNYSARYPAALTHFVELARESMHFLYQSISC